jgi:5S rRNA maturation endonuclease (ribonuclease M5)
MIMTKSPLNDQAKLKIVCDELCDNIDSLLDYFNLEYKQSHKMITMSCPIHDGDNPSAINIYPDGDYYRGNWKCRTHGCEKTFKGSILGFLRGVISHQKYGWNKDGDNTCSFKEALDFALAFLNKNLKDIKIPLKEREKKQFASVVSYLQKNNHTTNNGISREQVVNSLKIPASYYIQRNYSADILKKYDVGLCDTPGKEMYDRVVVPIYNNGYTKMIGCSGRSIYEKCQNCKGHHDPSVKCINPEIAWQYSKWKHSKDFKSQNHLYNFWFAKEHILKTHTAIIVESPGNVWRLEENGIHNSVGIFGSSLSDCQKILLDSSGAMNLVILTDNDEAGHKAAQSIKQKCQNTYRVFIPKISKSDVGEMNSEEINSEIKKYLESIV